MKKQDFSLSRLGSGFAVLLFFIISNGCTKPSYDSGGPGATLDEPSGYQVIIGSGSGYQFINGGGSEYQFSNGSGFHPLEIKVATGDRVTWINNSQETESVTSNQGLFDGILRNNESYSFKFTSAGTYTYFSRMHPGMTGTVIVK